MKFGLTNRKKLSGAGLYAIIFQVTAIVAVLYILVIPSFMSIITHFGVLSVLFDLGISALPRLEALAVSMLYRLSASEIAVHFAILGVAFIFGLVINSLLQGTEKKARALRLVLAVLIGADLLLRLLPLHFNRVFSLPASVAGFLIRLACLVLILLDLRADRMSRTEPKPGDQPPAARD